MLLNENTEINERGHLVIGGCDTVELAAKYGTPLYVMNEDTIRRSCNQFKTAMDKYFPNGGAALYAAKAFCCKEMCRIIDEEGLGIDVVSGGELFTAIQSGGDPSKIYFEGNYKTDAELSLALSYGIACIVVDTIDELHSLGRLATERGKTQDVMLRIKPGVEAHTHDFVKTGQIDSKFGFALETGEAFTAAKTASEINGVNLIGLHCHIGSQIFETDPFCLAAERLISLMAEIRDTLSLTLTTLDIGGGFGIQYTNEDQPRPFAEFLEKLSAAIESGCQRYSLPMPEVHIEPGRAVAGPAGVTLYKVGAVKEIPNIRNYVLIDGGMCDNPRYALYQSAYTVLIANKANAPCNYVATIAGRCCESGDLIQEDVHIASPVAGDIVAVLATGAYNYAMSMNYNRLPRPAVVIVSGGKSRVIVKGETYEDIIRNDI